MLATVTGSMPVKGSSSRMILGLETRQRAISSRRRSPPESEIASERRSFDDVELFQEFLAAAAAGLVVEAQKFHHAQQVFLHGELAKDAGFLGEIAHAPLARTAVHRPVVMSTPPSLTLPALGTIMPQVMRKLVVLPAPLGPNRPTISPLGRESRLRRPPAACRRFSPVR